MDKRNIRISFIENAENMIKIHQDADQGKTFPREVAELVHTCGKDLVELSAIERSEDAPLLNILGDQSSGKTTVGLQSLTEMPVFVTDANTGTKAKTVVNISHCATLEKDEAVCDMTYKKLEETKNWKNMTPKQLAKEYKSTFADKDIDPDDACYVKIRVGAPCFGLLVVDHPGLIMHSKDKTLECQQKTVNEFLKKRHSGSKHGSILLCHSITKASSEAGWHELKNLNELPLGTLTVAVTRMDQLNHNSVGKILKSKEVIKAVGIKIKRKNEKSKEVRYECTVLQILRAIIFDLCTHGNAGKSRLPKDTNFYFVASFRGEQNDLKKQEGLQERRNLFQHDAKTGERASEKDMMKNLESQKAWKKENIILTPMDQTDREEVFNMLGIDRLNEELLQKQTSTYYDLGLKLEAGAREELRKSVQHLAAYKEQRQQCLNFSDAAIDFLKTLVLVSSSLCTHQPLNPLQDTPAGSNDDSSIIINGYKADKNAISWSREDEILYHSRLLNPGEFPPNDRCEDCLDDILKNTSKPTDKAFKIPKVIERLQNELATRTVLIKSPELDFEEHMNEADRATTFSESTMSNFVSSKVSEECRTIWDSATRYIATRTANNILLNSEGVARLVSMISRFLPMCHGRVFGPGQIKVKEMQEIAEEVEKLAASNRRVQLRSIHLSECLAEFCKNLKDESGQKESVHPVDDVEAVMFALFFHKPEVKIETALTNNANSLNVTMCPRMVTFGEMMPLLMDRDRDYMKQWVARNHSHDYSRAFGPKPRDDIVKIVNDAMAQVQQKDKDANDKSPFVLCTQQATLIRKDSEEAPTLKFFQKVPQEHRSLIRNLNDLPEMTPAQKVNLIQSVLTIGVTPDDAVPLQDSTEMRDFEKRNLKIMMRRHLTAVNLQSLQHALSTIHGNLYEWTHSQTIGSHQKEAEERLLSMQLGFKYACTENERMKYGSHKCYDRVMHFIYRQKSAIKKYFIRQKQGDNDAKASREENGMEDGLNITVSEEERLMIMESPLIKCLFTLMLDNPEEGDKIIDQLLDAFTKEPKVFMAKLSEVLAKDRYKDHDPSDKINMKVAEYGEKEKVDSQFYESLKSFNMFLKSHGKSVVAALRNKKASEGTFLGQTIGAERNTTESSDESDAEPDASSDSEQSARSGFQPLFRGATSTDAKRPASPPRPLQRKFDLPSPVSAPVAQMRTSENESDNGYIAD